MPSSRALPGIVALTLVAGAAAPLSAGEVFPATVVLRAGDSVAGGQVVRTTTPRQTAGGVGFLALLDDDRHAIIYDGQVVSVANNPVHCDNPQFASGNIVADADFADDGRYLYTYYADFFENSIDGKLICAESHLFDENGLVYSDTDAAPGFADSALTRFDNPIMQPDATGYWAGIFVADLPGDGVGARNFNAIYRRDAVTGTDTAIWAPGQSVGGFPATSAGALRIAPDGSHAALMLTDRSDLNNVDVAIAVDDAVVATKWGPVGNNLIWETFRSLDINSAGDFAIAGTSSPRHLANPILGLLEVNGVAQLTEGDTLLGEELMDNCTGLSINDAGAIAFTWDSGEQNNAATNGAIYYASDADNIQGTARLLLRKGDTIDTDGDGVGDEEVASIIGNQFDPGYDLRDGASLIASVSLRPVQGGLASFATVALPLGCNPSDNAAPFGVLDLADVQGFVAAFTTQGDSADVAAPFGVWDLADVQAFVTGFNAGCP